MYFKIKKPVIDGHNPSGTSVMSAAFYAQQFNART